MPAAKGSTRTPLGPMLLTVPKSKTTPVPSLAWDVGGITMKYRIIMKKLLFPHHLTNLEDTSLAKQVLTVQDKHKCKEYFSYQTF